MSSNLSQVIYRPPTHPSQSHHPPEFIVYINLENFEKWKTDSSIPLINVLASSKDPIWVLPRGSTGLRTSPSKQELFDNFGTEDHFQAAEFILKNGRVVTPTNNGDLKNASAFEK